MKEYMKFQNQSGLSGVAAVLALMIFVLFMAVAVSLVTTGSNIGLQEEQGVQAFYIAEGGIERSLDAFYNNKTGCTSLSSLDAPLNPGNFDITGTLINPVPSTALSAAISNADTIIPVVSTAGYETAGRIWIDSEAILYKGTSSVAANCAPFSPPCFINASRAYDGTSPDTHSLGTSVRQKQCRIQSTGTITNISLINPIQRVTETGVPAVAADFLDSAPALIGMVETPIGTLNTSLTAGDNLIIVVVSLRNTSASADINAGFLRLRKGGVTLVSNQSLIRVGGVGAPSATVFQQETQFLLYKDTGAAANPTYEVTATATAARITGEVKIIVINNAPNSSFQDGGNVLIGSGPLPTAILTHASTVPKGDNIVIAAVQLDNTSNANVVRTIVGGATGNLRLNRVGLAAPLASNQFNIDLYRANRVNRGTGILLIAKDTGAPANPTYTVTGIASAAGVINGEVKIIVLNGLASAFLTGSVGVDMIETTIGSLATTFPAGENVVIAALQYDNSVAALRNIRGYEFTNPLPGNERIVFNNTPQSYNQFDINLCTTGTSQCDDFASGLLWHHIRATANPTYDVRARATATGIDAETKILAIHIKNKIPIYWKENY